MWSTGSISNISVYCTGDWDCALVDRHRKTVELLARKQTAPRRIMRTMEGAAPTGPSAGDVDAQRSALVDAFKAARRAGDAEAMAAAALAMPSSQRFGVYPGQIPAMLHEAYGATTSLSTRCRLAAALARSWVYGGDALARRGFAEESSDVAAEVAAPELVADSARRRPAGALGPGRLP